MAIFAKTIEGKGRKRGSQLRKNSKGRRGALAFALIGLPLLAAPAMAQTTTTTTGTVGNNGGENGNAILFEMLGYWWIA